MPGLIGASNPRVGGYLQYGTAQVPSLPGGGMPVNPRGIGYGTANINSPALGAPYPTLGWPASGQPAATYPVTPSNSRQGTRTATGGPPRWVDTIRAVLGSTPQTRAIGAQATKMEIPPVGPPPGRSNALPTLFGRPGFTYINSRSAPRIGPAAKLSPGTGQTGIPGNRSLGFAPPGYSSQQYIDVHQFDYTPPTDPTFDVTRFKSGTAFEELPRVTPNADGTGSVGVDGVVLVGTYRAHDFTPAARFFKQGRSSGNWQDMSFGPNYRWLQTMQQVQRYNLYTAIQLARGPSPNTYFLGYQTQPQIAQQIGGVVGQGAPLGYGSH